MLKNWLACNNVRIPFFCTVAHSGYFCRSFKFLYLKLLAAAILFCLLSICGHAQFYLRGEVRDDHGTILPGVKILLQSRPGTSYASGSSGTFGIPVPEPKDSITLLKEGYVTLGMRITTQTYQHFVLQPLPATRPTYHHTLSSVTRNSQNRKRFSIYTHGNETYNTLVENTFINTADFPQTGFSLNVDRAAYSNIRRFLNNGNMVPPDAVRIEEMLNYFNSTNSNEPNRKGAFVFRTSLTNTPWNAQRRLFFVNLQAPKLLLNDVPPANLIFLIDVSGSMDKPNRLPLLQTAFKLLVQNLRPQDSVAIVVYGGMVRLWLPATSAANKQTIVNAIEQLHADGDTPGESAIRLAYSVAQRSFNKNASNRVILATDGDFNVGQTDERDLEQLISAYRETGIYLTCLGVGMGNYKDSKLEALAKKGNGNFAYIDNDREAEKVLVQEFTKTLFSVANDAYLNVHFNPAYVKQYRLIGFDNREEALNDSTSRLEGGEIGTGHSLMAVFELEPTDSLLRAETSGEAKLASLKFNYRKPDEDFITLEKYNAPLNYQPLASSDKQVQLATSLCMFGELIKHSSYADPYTFEEVIKITRSCIDPNNPLHKEYLSLLAKAKKIYKNTKKKKQE
jgi:Ca-activated chloride channel family protein